MPLYEHVFIARQDISPAQVEGLTETLAKIVTDNGGENRKVPNIGVFATSSIKSTKTAKAITAFSTLKARQALFKNSNARKKSMKISCGR